MPLRSLLPAAALAGLIAGIFAVDARPAWADGWHAVAALAGALALASVALPRLRGCVLVAALVAGTALGLLRGPVAQPDVGPGSLASAIGPAEWRVEGTIVDEPRASGRRVQAVVDDLVLSQTGSGPPPEERREVRGRAIVWLPRAVDVASGDRIAFSSVLEAPRDFDGFAYRDYLARRGVAAVASAYEVETLARRAGGLASAFAGVRDSLLHGLQSTVPEPAAALGAGILLGVRSGMDQRVEDAFATSGLTHVVAISGWNIAIVAAAVSTVTARIRRRAAGRWAAPAVLIGAIVFYVVLTGASPSVVRAALMAGAALAARQAGSRAHAASALVVASGVMLAAAPPVLWDVGFQLSVLATAGLIVLGESVSARLARLPAAIREPVALTLAAQVFTLPVILVNFEQLSLVAPAANVLVAPLVPLAMAASALAALVGAADAVAHIPAIGDAAVWFVGGAAWLYLSAMIAIATVCASLPLAAVEISVPAGLAVAYYPAVVVAIVYLRKRRNTGRQRTEDADLPALTPPPASPGHRRGALSILMTGIVGLAQRIARPMPLVAATLTALVAFSMASAPDGRLHVTALDIGQGDAVLIEAPGGETVLIDGGPDPGLTLDRLAEALLFRVRHIDLVVLTHPHEDHIAGLIEVLDRYHVDTVLHPGRHYDGPALPRFLDSSAMSAERVVVARAGQRISIGDSVALDVIFPGDVDAGAPLPEGDINNASIVAILRHGAIDVLLTGDAERPVEQMLLDRGLVPRVEVLKVGHHGSESSTTAEFLAAADPRIALISSGAGNEYGHPAPVTLETLSSRPALQILRTDLTGSIELISDGARVWVAGPESGPASHPVSAHAGHPGHSVRADPGGFGELATIDRWPFQRSTSPARSSWTSVSRTASSRTAKACEASRVRRRGSSRGAGYRWTRHSSRPPPCSMTSTNCRHARGAAGTERWVLSTSSDSDIRSSPLRSGHTRCAA